MIDFGWQESNRITGFRCDLLLGDPATVIQTKENAI